MKRIAQLSFMYQGQDGRKRLREGYAMTAMKQGLIMGSWTSRLKRIIRMPLLREMSE